ncbi:hypothetical protein [Pinibacter soli]|uniref:Uncharacterized protein n=1 Tax=Pinibacter soli TaxID=3044211 RepID=A0ABT6RJ42_9BACT|nr:hypothetical protein [Pinibacter soli]MDI3322579.1 hypothetical protein [Pinibacter soli]
MVIQINDNLSLIDLQLEFSRKFPFLKIEFFKRQDLDDKSTKNYIVETESKCVCDVRQSHEEGVLRVNSGMTVEQFESSLIRKFNLPVKVFRKMGRMWRETRITSNWSLQLQNEHGKRSDDRLELFW